MNLYSLVKAAVTTRQAAEYYGKRVERNGLTCCPFHHDKTPSMKVDERYYCFGCHETGDVIDFTAKLFNLSPYDTAMKLSYDFGIDPHTPTTVAVRLQPVEKKEKHSLEGCCASILIDYERLLKRVQACYAPNNPQADWDARFAAACRDLPQVSFWIDCLYSPDSELRAQIAEQLLQDGTMERVEIQLRHSADEKEVDLYANEPFVA